MAHDPRCRLGGIARHQWRYWTDLEMTWQKTCRITLCRATSNHTAYDDMSEAVCREVLQRIPWDGLSDHPGLSYAMRRGNLLLVFVNTGCSASGDEGYAGTDWIHRRDGATRVTAGHHPIYATNGYSAPSQHIVDPERRCGWIFTSPVMNGETCARRLPHLPSGREWRPF